MDYPFEHSDFEGRTLELRTSGLFGAVRLVVDGAEVAAIKGKFTAHDNQGNPREFKLKASPFGLDPVPKLLLDGTTIAVVSPLKWYEYAWMSLPILLVFAGGGLGALFGMIAAYSSTRIFRSNRGAAEKYFLSGLYSVGAAGAFFASAVGLQLAIVSIFPASEFALDQVAQTSNAQLPVMIDDQTELVRVEGLKGVLVQNFRLTKVARGQLPGEILLQRLRPTISANACADDDSRERFLENGVVLRYAYSDADGNAIAHFDVSAEDCR